MAKQKKPANRNTYDSSEQEAVHARWMLRLKIGSVYIIAWFFVMLWMTSNLPNPINTEFFFGNSNAHWVINIGLLIMFIVIQMAVSKKVK